MWDLTCIEMDLKETVCELHSSCSGKAFVNMAMNLRFT
jgi:hypothetical protein